MLSSHFKTRQIKNIFFFLSTKKILLKQIRGVGVRDPPQPDLSYFGLDLTFSIDKKKIPKKQEQNKISFHDSMSDIK